MKRAFVLTCLLPAVAYARAGEWYTQGGFSPALRIEYTVENTLDMARKNAPVVILRKEFPLPDLHEMMVTVVDPSLEPSPAPSAEVLRVQGGHQLQAEANGHAVFHQLDDLDKDGIWDELFFQTDLEPKQRKTIYIYIGYNTRGWNKHHTHAAIGSYCRHLMPFWETESIGWKIWFANSVDVYSKRAPVLMSNKLYMDNLDGYGVSHIDKDYGSDIQGVSSSFGGGAICLFEYPDDPSRVSMPRFTPVHDTLFPRSLWNAGQISDTRYAYEVVVNGPIRSMVKIKGMNWNTGQGSYAYEQTYAAYAHQAYCISKVRFVGFNPTRSGVTMGCGLKKKPREDNFICRDGLLVTSGPEGIRDPENIDDRAEYVVPFIGSALIVPRKYQPEYRYIPTRSNNHAFSVTPDADNSFEYMLLGGWSEGYMLSDKEQFNAYAAQMHREYNTPPVAVFVKTETKQP